MKRILVANSQSGRLYSRRLWIDLACNLAICYYYYNATRIAGAASDVDLSLEDAEENFPHGKPVLWFKHFFIGHV